MHPYDRVENVDKVADVVERPPETRDAIVQFPENGSSGHENNVI